MERVREMAEPKRVPNEEMAKRNNSAVQKNIRNTHTHTHTASKLTI